ncbi:hypothetical protein BHM03_00000916 [Ensete ventricosum]|nr:hypothetical protein BHM03_00000916 [Ensete ventricosum]
MRCPVTRIKFNSARFRPRHRPASRLLRRRLRFDHIISSDDDDGCLSKSVPSAEPSLGPSTPTLLSLIDLVRTDRTKPLSLPHPHQP